MLLDEQEPLLSPDWYRVAYLRPRLRNGIKVSQHRLRGECWYVIADPVSGRHYRFNAQAYSLISLLTGDATIDEVWSGILATDGDDAPTQAEVMRTLSQAFGANLFVGNLEVDAETIVGAQRKQTTKRRLSRLNPLAIRIPLWDPDRFLTAHLSKISWLMTYLSQSLILLAIGASAILLAMNAEAFSDFAVAHLGNGSTLLMLWLVFPVVKGLHELAHAFTVKSLGGEVHEIGITLLMLTPMPYVDASASTALPRKQDRIKVAAAGIVMEAFIASIAIPLWLLLEPGLLRELTFVVVFAGVISTLLINGNPLLRFDGYYVFCDWIEAPNLSSRSQLYWQSLIKRTLFRVHQARFGNVLPGETGWLLAYAPLSWLYRVFLILMLCQMLTQWSNWLGMAMFCFGAWLLVGKPLRLGLGWLLNSAELHGRRLRAQLSCTLVVMFGGLILGTLPVPDRTYAAAIVWLPENAIVRLQAEGQVQEVLAQDKQWVQAGEPIALLANDRLRTELAGLEAEVETQKIELARQFKQDAKATISAKQKFQAMLATRDVLQRRVDGLTVRAGTDGYLAIDPGHLSPGQYLSQGTVVAQVMPEGPVTVRALVGNDDIALVRKHTETVSVTSLAVGGADRQARITRVTPLASRQLPSAALAMDAGGPIEIDHEQSGGLQARQARFAFDLTLTSTDSLPVGSRAMAVFDHGSTTLGSHIGRVVRESFLRHFST